MFRRFLKRDSDPHDFRERVLTVSAKLFPDLLVIASQKKAEVIIVNGSQLGLQNLKAKFDLSDRSQKSLETLITEHFAPALSAVPEVPDLETARPRLRPQIMPPEFMARAPLVSFPFGKTLAVGIVLDTANSYSYVRQEDATKWAISPSDLFQAAITGLDE